MEKGNIIWLNGVSSAGKSTLARALQRKLPKPYFCISQDTFTDVIAPWLSGEFQGEDADKLWFQAVSAMNHTVRLYADLGYNVIVDHVILQPQPGDWGKPLDEALGLLHDYPVWFVQVNCPLEELERREVARGDREIGNARWQAPLLHPQEGYDLTVNTHACTIEDCADQIIARLAQGPAPAAFSMLYDALELN